MPLFIDYVLKLSICLAVVYLFYLLFLRQLTFYNWNRWYLLGYTALSFIIPLINIMPELQKKELDKTSLLQWIPALGYETAREKNFIETLGYWDWALIIVAAGSLFLSVNFIIRFYAFAKMKRKAKLLSGEQTKIYQIDEDITPFSFGNSIFINKEQHGEEELQEIIRHEFVHVKQKHTFDIIWCELLCIFNWFSPFVWLLRSAMKQNLEFIADNKVLQNGFDKKEYQYLLLKVMGNRQFAFTNHFNFSSLKKRIIMMNTIKTAKIHLAKFLFLLPVVAVLLLAFRKEMKEISNRQLASYATDTLPANDTSEKISVITTPGGFENKNMERTIIDRMSVEDWNKNKEYYEKKYGKQGAIQIFTETKNGKEVKYDSVYVTKYKPSVIKPGEEPLIIVDGSPIAYEKMKLIKPDEIESINVLKNENATSQYGDKGKYGVILITMKHGKLKAISKKAAFIHEFEADSMSIIPKGDKETITLHGNVSGVIKRDSGNNNEVQVVELNTADLQGKAKNIVVAHRNSKGIDASENTIGSNAGEKRVVIRESANSSANPLIIVDEKMISKDEFAKMNPENIRSINILKDKSASTLYGSKAKDGVIIITTKNGKIIATDKERSISITADTLHIN